MAAFIGRTALLARAARVPSKRVGRERAVGLLQSRAPAVVRLGGSVPRGVVTVLELPQEWAEPRGNAAPCLGVLSAGNPNNSALVQASRGPTSADGMDASCGCRILPAVLRPYTGFGQISYRLFASFSSDAKPFAVYKQLEIGALEPCAGTEANSSTQQCKKPCKLCEDLASRVKRKDLGHATTTP